MQVVLDEAGHDVVDIVGHVIHHDEFHRERVEHCKRLLCWLLLLLLLLLLFWLEIYFAVTFQKYK